MSNRTGMTAREVHVIVHGLRTRRCLSDPEDNLAGFMAPLGA